MNITAQQAQKLLSGNHTFKQLGFSMLLTRLKMLYKNDNSPSSLGGYTDEINAFLAKYKIIMAEDINVIAQI